MKSLTFVQADGGALIFGTKFSPRILRGTIISKVHSLLRNSSVSHLPDSNRGPSLYKSVALPAELRWRKLGIPILQKSPSLGNFLPFKLTLYNL